MDVGVGIVINFAATGAFIAAIYGHAVLFGWILAIQGLGQGAGERFEFFDLVAGKQVGMAEPAARERALQDLRALLAGEMFEGHGLSLMVPTEGVEPKLSGFAQQLK
jgi:hypothetical protein